MPIDYYPNLAVDELLPKLTSLQKRATEGLVNFTTAAGIQSQKTFQGAGPVSVEIRRVLYSLHLKDSDTFKNPYAQRVRRTRALYTLS